MPSPLRRLSLVTVLTLGTFVSCSNEPSERAGVGGVESECTGGRTSVGSGGRSATGGQLDPP
ncbi:MAG: hypothetical protein B6A08_13655 [Sorangiineae bacterium NIC37A_2]|nr:MAG: hypothetical protein B6A08_13655 [Sorangiineae bacterium NIC37A_2]